LSILKAAVEQAAKEKFGKTAKNLKSPFHKAEEKLDEDRMPEGFDPTGWTMLRANTYQQRPTVMFANGTAVPENELLDEVYNGRWARISVRAHAYDNESRGVKLYLHNVQVLAEGEKWPSSGGRTNASDEFEAIELANGKAASSDGVFG
jgi:hypothetical protein